MADYRYNDADLFKIRAAVFEHLKRYFSACHNSRNYITAVEKNISEKLLPTLEDLFMDDLMNGGVHDVKYMEINKQKLLSLDRVGFCNYQAAKGAFEKKIGIPLEGKFDLNAEGKKILQMIDDLRSMDAREFSAKYYTPPVCNGMEKLLSAIGKTTDLSSFFNASYTETMYRLDGTLDERAKIAAAQFFNANINDFRKYAPRYENQILYFADNPVESIDAILIFKREDTSQPFYAAELDISLYYEEPTDGDEETPPNAVRFKFRSANARFKFDITHEQGKEFGEKITHDVLVPKYGAEITASADRKERNYHDEKERSGLRRHGRD